MLGGADLSSLDIYVNPKPKVRFRGKDLSTGIKPIHATARELGNLPK